MEIIPIAAIGIGCGHYSCWNIATSRFFLIYEEWYEPQERIYEVCDNHTWWFDPLYDESPIREHIPDVFVEVWDYEDLYLGHEIDVVTGKPV